MKNIIKLVLLCILFFNHYLALAQPCTASLVPPVTLANGITVTSTFTGSVDINPSSFTSCGSITTPPNSLWLGENGTFSYKVIFSVPVNNIRINITSANLGEVFTFTTDVGNPAVNPLNLCSMNINGNVVSTGGSSTTNRGAGEITISNTTDFSWINITGPGLQEGSFLAICENSVNPCPDNLTLVNVTDDVNNNMNAVKLREVIDWIKATNKINVGNSNAGVGVVYTAGNYIELNTDFEAVSGSQFAAYIKPCPGTFVYRPVNNTITQTSNPSLINESINSKENDLTISPNPSNNTITITMQKHKFKKVAIVAIDGKRVFERNYDAKNTCSIDISDFKKGIYIVYIISMDGQQLSKKLIKN